MANWNNPTINSNYTDFVAEVKARDEDAIKLDGVNPTNLPNGAIRFNRSTNIFEELDTSGPTWGAKVLAIAGGGTGATSASGARTALGIGSMGTQNSNNVTITGGTISGVNLSADTLTSGTVALARGGTGASLTLGSSGQVLMSNGSSVVFAAGTSIAALNASNLSTGTVPTARLPSTVVYTTGTQTISGFKTFTSALTVEATLVADDISLVDGTFSFFNGGDIRFFFTTGTSTSAIHVHNTTTFSIEGKDSNCDINIETTRDIFLIATRNLNMRGNTATYLTNSGGVSWFGVDSGGCGIVIGSGDTLSLSGLTLTTTHTAGPGANAPLGYFTVVINGTTRKIGYYGV